MEHPTATEAKTAENIQRVIDRAKGLGKGCNDRAARHELSYQRWSRRGTLTSMLTVIGSTVAGSSLLFSTAAGSNGTIIAGIVGLTAALLAAVNSSWNMRGRAEDHRRARADFTNLRTRYYELRELPPDTYEEARKQIEDIRQRHAQVEEEAPPPEPWTENKVN